MIKNNGFNAEEADITASARSLSGADKPVLSVTGTEDQILILVADPKNAKAFEQIRESARHSGDAAGGEGQRGVGRPLDGVQYHGQPSSVGLHALSGNKPVRLPDGV